MKEEMANEIENAPCRVCPWQTVRTFDNFIRPWVHNPRKLFGKYVKPGMTVLDLGCGAGWASIGLARLVGEKGKVIAVDLQPEMLRMVQKRIRRQDMTKIVTTHLCQENSTGLTTKADFALAFWMIHETPRYQTFLEEVYNCLNPGGHFYIAEPKMHVSEQKVNELISDAEGLGFKVTDMPKVRLSRAVVLMKNA